MGNNVNYALEGLIPDDILVAETGIVVPVVFSLQVGRCIDMTTLPLLLSILSRQSLFLTNHHNTPSFVIPSSGARVGLSLLRVQSDGAQVRLLHA